MQMRARGNPVVVALVAMLLVLPLTGPKASAAPTRRQLLIGVAAPGAPTDLTEVRRFERASEVRPTVAGVYLDFLTSFDPTAMAPLMRYGAVPLVTWEPWSVPLESIADGSYDSHLRAWATSARDWGRPLLLRFAHEMNGDWYPWSARNSSPATYVAAWRHARSVFRSAGATNVRWVWSPNVVADGFTPLRKLYPGDRHVDWVGIDGYNWGNTAEWSSWQSFSEIFGRTLRAVRRLSNRPIMLSEVGSTESGGDKGAWMRHMYDALQRNRDIKAFVWFNFDKETDWRIQSSARAKAAFAARASEIEQPVAKIIGA